MKTIRDLKTLISSMMPKLDGNTYVFCHIPADSPAAAEIPNKMSFEEDEGRTLVVEKSVADASTLPYSATWSMITLTVHSDLEAVGFLAKITEKLAAAGISVNAVSAFHHDHLFVPVSRAKEALSILEKMAAGS